MKQAAKYIKDHNEEIINHWEEIVKQEIEASKNTHSLALRNQLPHVLKDIAEIMNRYNDFEEIRNNENFEEIISNSLDHGRHRATSSSYSVDQILQEFIVFHKVITEKLRENNSYTTEVGILLKYTLETAMVKSASSFNDSLQAMREKLIGTLAHDIRNPISTAYLALDMVNYEDGPERLDKITRISKQCLKNSIELIEGLLDAISLKAGDGITFNFEKCDIMKDLRWVYNECVEIFRNEIVLETDSDEIIGIFDGAAVRRIIENLMTNAIKYGAKDKPITMHIEDGGDYVSICVHNYGNPIPEEKQSNIFKFLNTSRQVNTGHLKSWGMGLSLVKIVAEAHGGKVLLKSNAEDGTSFIIFLDKKANKPGMVKSKLNFSEHFQAV